MLLGAVDEAGIEFQLVDNDLVELDRYRFTNFLWLCGYQGHDVPSFLECEWD